MPIAELIVIKGENYKRWDIPLPIGSLKKNFRITIWLVETLRDSLLTVTLIKGTLPR